MNSLKEAKFNAAAAAVAGSPHAVGRARERAKALRYEKPQSSNRQPHAIVPRHPEVTRFFRRDGFISSGSDNVSRFRNCMMDLRVTQRMIEIKVRVTLTEQ